jgi:radical SAM superfamily enzyme YgiQ (UPF0313 family)
VKGSGNRTLLLVNPWVHDFSAYDLWMKPLGLLYLGGILRSRGFRVDLLDCLEFTLFPEDLTRALKPPKKKEYGRGHVFKEIIPKPEPLRSIPRQYRRYGIPPETAREYLRRLPRPDLALVTSSMTYWYPGVLETIRLLRETLPGVPVILGGVYATLCSEHARHHSGADRVLPGSWDGDKMRILGEVLGEPIEPGEEGFRSWPYPAFDLYPHLPYTCLLTRRGCPFSCTYCAAHLLAPGLESRPPEDVVEELAHWNEKFGVKDFAFYDDALLVNPAEHILPILRGVIGRRLPCRFHVPNALHGRFIDLEVAECFYRAGVRTIRIGLETADEALQEETGGKVTDRDFRGAVENLKKAGYAGREIGVYLMAGLPGQRAADVEDSIAYVRDTGARPVLVEYSPIPGTALFAKALRGSSFDVEAEPLFQNNSLLPCQWEGFTWENFRRLKEILREEP